MRTQAYKSISLACFVAGNVATAGAIGTWLSGRMAGNSERAHDGLFLAAIGTAFFALGNRVALASLDRAERVRWTGEDDSDVAMAQRYRGEYLPQPAPEIDAEEVPMAQARPLSHVKRGGSF